MAQIVQQSDGSYVALTSDGRRVPVSNEMAGNAVPQNVLNEQGVSVGERFYVKNFAANDEAAMGFLRSHGYQVRKYGNHPLKMQFAVRKDANDPWRVVDPDGFEPEDLLDLVADIGQGAAITAATAGTGGLGGAMLAGAAAGGGSELLRQGIGAATGLGSQNIDPAQIASQAVGGAAAEPIGRAVGAVTSGISRAALDLAAKVSGARATAGMGAGEATSEFASRKPLFGKAKIMSFQEVAEKWYNTLKNEVFGDKFPERVQFDQHLVNAKDAGLRFDVSPLFSRLEELLPQEGEEVAKTVAKRSITDATRTVRSTSGLSSETRGTISDLLTGESRDVGVGKELETVAGREASTQTEANVSRTTFERPLKPKSVETAAMQARGETNPAQVRKILDDHMALLNAFAEHDGEQLDLTKVSPEAVNELRKSFQALARKAGVYDNLPLPAGTKKVLGESAKDARATLLDGMTKAGGDFGKAAGLLKKMDEKTRVWSSFKKAMRSSDDLRNYAEKVYGKYNSKELRMANDLRKYFGVDILPDIRGAQAGVQVGLRGGAPGELSTLPQVGYHGGIAGLIGYTLAGPAGVAPAIVASSPKTVVAATRLGQQAAKVMSTPAVSQAARAAGIQTLQEVARTVGKGLSREPEKPKRRNVIGGS